MTSRRFNSTVQCTLTCYLHGPCDISRRPLLHLVLISDYYTLPLPMYVNILTSPITNHLQNSCSFVMDLSEVICRANVIPSSGILVLGIVIMIDFTRNNAELPSLPNLVYRLEKLRVVSSEKTKNPAQDCLMERSLML